LELYSQEQGQKKSSCRSLDTFLICWRNPRNFLVCSEGFTLSSASNLSIAPENAQVHKAGSVVRASCFAAKQSNHKLLSILILTATEQDSFSSENADLGYHSERA
jgi:hypothetical protein